MPKQLKKHLIPFMLGIFLTIPGSVSAAADFNLADVPLAVISSVEPNVMLLLDNSGSMDNVVWYQGGGNVPAFDAATDYSTGSYTDWSDGRWNATETYMTLTGINSGNEDGTCNPGNPVSNQTVIENGVSYTVPRIVVQGEDSGGNLKCLILPDILDNGRTRYTGNYLNYLFNNFADGSNLTGVIPFKTRLMVMKDVTTGLLSTTTGMRFGLTVFNGGSGGDVLANCGTAVSSISSRINGLTADSSTPLAEAMYEVTRYFRGMSRFSTNGGNFTSPIQYSCQKNFVIAVTDGLPTSDRNYDNSDPDIDTYCPRGPGNCSLPNWDGLANNNTYDPRFRDGNPSGNNEGDALFFDDIVKFAYDIDAKTGTGFDEPPFDKQNIETYSVGFSISNQMLRDAGHYGSGLAASDAEVDPPTNYFTADDESQLKQQLESALTSIEGKSGSAASVAASTGFIGAGTSVYQGLFDTNSWTGNIIKYDLSILNNIATITKSNVDAASVMSTQLASGNGPSARNIISYNPDIASTSPGARGIKFEWASLTASQKSKLDDRQEILEYVRGDRNCEVNNTSGVCNSPKTKNLRDRDIANNGMLGTIVNSSPQFVSKPLEYYPAKWPGTNAPENADTAEKYYDFKEYNSNRREIVYVGANDGMLHAFDADTMEELFAYVPNEIYSKLTGFADQQHTHSYLVDGTPTIIESFFGSNVGGDSRWHTVLVAGLNKGGQGIYALDITDPTTFSSGAKNNVLWEFTDENDRDLGYTFSKPAIVRMHNGVWAAVFGNGYNNTEIDEGDANGDKVIDSNDDTGNNDSLTGNAVLYIVNLRTGALIQKIDTGVGTAQDPAGNNRPNGLSTVAPVDIDNDFIVDYIYAGDLFGNLWRFDVTGPSAGSWKIFGKGNQSNTDPIFQARYTENNQDIPQPITSRLDATTSSTGGLMLYFGTGQYLQLSDISDKSVQSFYGLLDDPISDSQPPYKSSPVTRASMIRQTIISEGTYTSNGVTQTVRQFSKNASSNNFANWYIDLIVTGGAAQGERVVGAPIVRGITRKKIVFNSIIPTQDVCDFGGRSWLIELDARNGNLTPSPVFDLNFDGKLDQSDNGSGTIVYNGWSQKGIITKPAILKSRDQEHKIISSSTGVLQAVGEATDVERDGARHSWRQIK